MRYRKLDSNGDFSFGHGRTDYYENVTNAVGQAILTKLRLFYPEWWHDTDDGTRYNSVILGKNRDIESIYIEIRRRINEVPNIVSIDTLDIQQDTENRRLYVTIIVTSDFGQIYLKNQELSTNPFVTIN